MDPLDTESETEAFGEAETTVIHHNNLDTLILPQHLMNLQTAVMDSDTEITVVTIGKETPNQALFIQEKHLSLTLQEIRDVLASQSLSLPSHFKFMSCSRNIIAIPTEQRITLKKLIGQDDKGKPNIQMFIYSMRSKNRKANASEELQNEDIGSDATNQGDIEGSLQGPKGNAGSGRCIRLSFGRKALDAQEENPLWTVNGSCHIEGSNSNWKVLFRALIAGVIVLIAGLLLLWLTLFLVTCIMGVFHNEIPGFHTESDDVMQMRMKMGELEVSYRYDIQELKTRLDDIDTQATAHTRRMAQNMAMIMARFDLKSSVPPTDKLPTTEAKETQKGEPKVAGKGSGDSRSKNSYAEKHEQKTSN